MCKHFPMEPEQDPEARIRDLERSLADRAQYSELGTRPYTATPPADAPADPNPYRAQPQHVHGSPQYGSPYYAPPQRVVHKRPQTALWLILLVGVIGVGIAGLVMFLTLDMSDIGPQTSPGVDTPEVEIPFTPTEDVLTVGAGDTLSVGGIGQDKTLVCDRGTVNISGMTNVIEIQGDCAGVSVSGMNNTITVESAQSITASGFENQVTYRAGTPEISKSGEGNVIEQG